MNEIKGENRDQGVGMEQRDIARRHARPPARTSPKGWLFTWLKSSYTNIMKSAD